MVLSPEQIAGRQVIYDAFQDPVLKEVMKNNKNMFDAKDPKAKVEDFVKTIVKNDDPQKDAKILNTVVYLNGKEKFPNSIFRFFEKIFNNDKMLNLVERNDKKIRTEMKKADEIDRINKEKQDELAKLFGKLPEPIPEQKPAEQPAVVHPPKEVVVQPVVQPAPQEIVPVKVVIEAPKEQAKAPVDGEEVDEETLKAIEEAEKKNPAPIKNEDAELKKALELSKKEQNIVDVAIQENNRINKVAENAPKKGEEGKVEKKEPSYLAKVGKFLASPFLALANLIKKCFSSFSKKKENKEAV